MFEIPHFVNDVYAKREELRSLREHVLLVVRLVLGFADRCMDAESAKWNAKFTAVHVVDLLLFGRQSNSLSLALCSSASVILAKCTEINAIVQKIALRRFRDLKILL